MREGLPVNVRRGAFGTWFATRGEKDAGNGFKEATTRFPVARETAEQLEALYDSHGWLKTLLEATGKTREQIADDYELTIKAVD